MIAVDRVYKSENVTKSGTHLRTSFVRMMLPMIQV
jgi:hypothetical protein